MEITNCFACTDNRHLSGIRTHTLGNGCHLYCLPYYLTSYLFRLNSIKFHLFVQRASADAK